MLYVDEDGNIKNEFWKLFYPLRTFPSRIKGGRHFLWGGRVHDKRDALETWAQVIAQDPGFPYAN